MSKFMSLIGGLLLVGSMTNANANLIENKDVFCAFPKPCIGACEPYRYLHKQMCATTRFSVYDLNDAAIKKVEKEDLVYAKNLQKAYNISLMLGNAGMSAFKSNQVRDHDEIDSYIKWQANRKNKDGVLTKDMWCKNAITNPLKNLLVRGSAEVDINQANKWIVRTVASGEVPTKSDFKPWYGFKEDFEYKCDLLAK